MSHAKLDEAVTCLANDTWNSHEHLRAAVGAVIEILRDLLADKQPGASCSPEPSTGEQERQADAPSVPNGGDLQPGDEIVCKFGSVGGKRYGIELVEGKTYTVARLRKNTNDIYLTEMPDISWDKKRFCLLRRAEQQPTPQADVTYSRLGGVDVAEKRIAELEEENKRLRTAIAANFGGRQLLSTDSIERLERVCVEDSSRISEREAEVERLQQQLNAEQNRSGRLEGDLNDALRDLDSINALCRTFGYGQGEIDNGMASCLRQTLDGLQTQLAEERAMREQLNKENTK